MSETKHTPGPWKAIEWSCHARTTVVTKIGSVSPVVVAECAGHGRDTNESLGDAALIAAAPELLEAIEALGFLPEGYCFCFGGTRDANKPESEHFGECREVRAAIRKARGE